MPNLSEESANRLKL